MDERNKLNLKKWMTGKTGNMTENSILELVQSRHIYTTPLLGLRLKVTEKVGRLYALEKLLNMLI